MKLRRFFLLLGIPLYLISCRTQRIPNYLQNVTDTTVLANVQIPELRIQKNDVIAIQVYSASTKPEISDVAYNLPVTGTSETPTMGFLVDARGNIEYPRVGLLHAEGLTRQELADTIKYKINEKDSVLTNPSVIVRFMNLKVTLLGEVNNQGVIQIPGDRMTVMEAIGLAGGITDFGLKQSVKVIREVNGKREVGQLDLSSSDVFKSPYYNLSQNDLVFVDPTKRKQKKVEQETFFRQAGFLISIITAMAVVVRLFQ